MRRAGRRIGPSWIWRNVSIELRPGDRLGVTGPSGAGKTLLFRALAGLDRLDEGDVVFRGKSIREWSLPEYRSRIAYVMQTPALLEGTVEDNLRAAFGFSVHRRLQYEPEWTRRHLDLLGRGEDFLTRDAAALSGGERQLVAFLRALQLEPEVLLLDEPTASLDAEVSRQIQGLLADWLSEDCERATVWSSHLGSQIERVTDRQVDLTRFRADAG